MNKFKRVIRYKNQFGNVLPWAIPAPKKVCRVITDYSEPMFDAEVVAVGPDYIVVEFDRGRFEAEDYQEMLDWAMTSRLFIKAYKFEKGEESTKVSKITSYDVVMEW